jgi:ArsR family transcriptional regulator
MTTSRSAREALRPEQFELIAKALADPRRVALLEAIAKEQCCGCMSLRRKFPVSKATISHHIKELVRAGLVIAERQGQYLQCRVRREVLEAYTSALLRRVGAAPEADRTSRS